MILRKCKPLVHTRAQRAVQKNKTKNKTDFQIPGSCRGTCAALDTRFRQKEPGWSSDTCF